MTNIGAIAGMLSALGLLGGCGAPTPTHVPILPSATSAAPIPTTPTAARCLELRVPIAPAVACAELRDGIETYSDAAPRALSAADYYVIGECLGKGDLDELPYTVRLDDETVSSGSISCRSGLVTKNSAFNGQSGNHRVSVRFAEGVGANASGYAVVRPG